MSKAYAADSLRLRMESNIFLVALQDESIIGFAEFRAPSQTEVEITAIYVLPGVQGRGIGTRLLEAGVERFPSGTTFVLRVERDNASAQHFYEAHGFRPTGEFVEVYLGHEFHDVEMVLDPGS